MKKSTRILILLLVFELGLAGLLWWLLTGLRSGAFTPSEKDADTAATVSSTIGGAMGFSAAVMLVLWFALRLRESGD